MSLWDGKQDVALQDQTTPDIILRFNRTISSFILDGIQNRDSFILNVIAGHGAVLGNIVCIQQFDVIFNIPRFFQAQIVVANATNFELDRPLDFAFDPAKVLCTNLSIANLAGSIGTISSPLIYKIKPLSGIWDITRIVAQVFTSNSMDDGKFGSIPALTHGLTIRRKNLFWYNSFNIKSNGAWSSIAYDSKYADKPPAGTGNGFASRLTWAGQNKIGVAKRLNSATNDELEIVQPDDLSGFSADDIYIVTAEGHIVEG